MERGIWNKKRRGDDHPTVQGGWWLQQWVVVTVASAWRVREVDGNKEI